MEQVAADLEISPKRLKILCHRVDVPIPIDEFWAKKKAGETVEASSLPTQKRGVQGFVKIRLSEGISCLETPTADHSVHQEITPEPVLSAHDYKRLHPKIRFWVDEHKRIQAEQRRAKLQEQNDPSFDGWSWVDDPRIDLTTRDIYRFQFTSSLLYAIEKAGGRVAESPVSGRLVVLVDNEKIECTVVEKMARWRSRSLGDPDAWSAYPEHHSGGLHSTGFLRVEITTHLNTIRQRKWIEASDKRIETQLSSIVAEILAAGPVLVEMRSAREEREKQYEKERAEERERVRLQRLDNERWSKFQKLAIDWEECRRIRVFLDALREKAKSDTDTVVDDRTIADWIAWAEARLSQVDPAQRSAIEIVEAFMPDRWAGYSSYGAG
ncbi:hypothetical protein [Pelagibius sp. Alg239-R121]|uniref:hypothetical protein n=1 Tax=Pelagibius sp. Alg239-R121 TaxID=2993448 RepID=UPI0024A72722|nr:hypothetical protein [Pelagibius sp. Alg239-R121]